MGRKGVGFGNTARAVAEPFIDKIELNSKVTSIDYSDPEKVEIEYTKNDIKHNIIAKSVLVTVSLGVLKAGTINFTPRLPNDKQDGIDGITMGLVNKVILVWDDDMLPNEQWISLITPDSGTSGQFTTFLNPSQYKGVQTITAWIGGDDAKIMESKSDEVILEEVMSHLHAIYPSLAKPNEYYISRWGKEENFKGAYSCHTLGRSRSQDARRIGERIGRLSFAGEATAASYGSTKGAFDSGVRGAKEMIEVLN